MRRNLTFAAALLLGATPLVSGAAFAGTIAFNATRTNNRTMPSMTAFCPGLTLAFLPGAPTFNQGTSNLGDFAATIYECPVGPPPAANVNSPWSFAFDNGTLFGTKSGNPTGPVDGGIGFVSTFTVLGGTGYFGGATGSFSGVGTLVFARTPAAIETLTGVLQVPEPALAALFGVAFAGVALARRG